MRTTRQGGRILCFCLFVFLYGCAGNVAVRKQAAIDVTHQSVYLGPVKGWERLESASFWPAEPRRSAFLVQDIQQVWKNLLAEFRRCEKYGLYTMVDSSAMATVAIVPEITSSVIRNDSLVTVFTVTTVCKEKKTTRTMTIDAYGIFKPGPDATLSLENLVSAFTDLRRNFPYEKTVSFFYAHGNQ